MRVTSRFTVIVSVAIGLIAAQAMVAAAAADKVFDKRFPASPGGTLTVDTDQGAIVVSGGDTQEVVVHVTLSGTEAQMHDFEVSADTDNRGVAVRGKRYNDWWLDLSWLFGGGLRARFEIQVPHDYRIDVRTSGGGIEAQNINGDVHGRTAGGDLTLVAIRGAVDVHTSGGRIDARRLTGNAQLHTSGGSITIADARGELDVRTSGGAIRLQNIEGKVAARTSGGSIEASLHGANQGVNLRTSGGSINVDIPKTFTASLDAHTSGGGIHCELPVTARRDDDRHHNTLFGDINGGGEPLIAQTSGGSIRIRMSQ